MKIRASVIIALALLLSLAGAAGCSDDGSGGQVDSGISDAGGDAVTEDTGSGDADKDATDATDTSEADAGDATDVTDAADATDAADGGHDADPDGGDADPDAQSDAGDAGDAGDVEEDTGPPPVDDLDPTGGWWSEDYSMPGLQGASGARGYTLAADPNSDDIYVAGIFEVAGMTAAEDLASWDGTQWNMVGSSPPSIEVAAIAFDAGGKLYAGGSGGGGMISGPNTLETWDGSSWRSLATVGGGDVATIEILSDGRVIVGGDFTDMDGTTAENLAVYDGQDWSQLGGAQPDGPVRTIEEMSDGRICIGGDFDQVGATDAGKTACYDGSQWQALGDPLNSGVRVLLEDTNGDLLAGGTFSVPNDQGGSDIGVARWDGTAWQGVAGGVVGGTVTSVRALAHGPNGELFVGGTFSSAGSGSGQVAASNIARLDTNGTWSPLGSGVANQVGVVGAGVNGVNDLWVDGSNNQLVTTGLFSHAGGQFALNIARWTLGSTGNSGWTTMVSNAGEFMGADRLVSALETAPNGDVYASGGFSVIGGIEASKAAVWNQSSWQALGGGLDGRARDIVVDSSGNAHFGGDFNATAGQLISNLATWDGNGWVDPGAGSFGEVRALALDANDVLYIAAEDAQAGGYTVYSWDGTNRQKIGESFANTVNALEIGPNGDLYAGGHFEEDVNGNALSLVARFDGTDWVEVDGGLSNGYVTSMDVYDGELLVGGRYDEAGGQAAGSIALWDGTTWDTLSGGLPPSYAGGSPPVVTAVATKANGFFVTGTMSSIDSLDVNYVAWYDGQDWHALGVGMADLGEALAISNYRLFVGGPFTMAGDGPSYHIAEWNYVP